jgi:hypothetical protein
MTLTVDIPPLTERALSEYGATLLAMIAETERNLGTPTIKAAATRIKRRVPVPHADHYFYNVAYGLENAGLLEIRDGGSIGTITRLTDAGWQLAGGKPLWRAK